MLVSDGEDIRRLPHQHIAHAEARILPKVILVG
jgi:hypothetical protein